MGTLDDVRGAERRHQVQGSTMDRELRVKALHSRLEPEQVRGLRLTDPERAGLLARLELLRAEVDNAGVYYGADL